MRLEIAFRRSLYLSLALASAALCVSESSFLPEIPVVAVLVGGLLLVAYFMEGRWSLGIGAANSLGMILTALLGIWIAYQFFRPQSESLIYQLPWPTSLLPYLGPVLLILIPAKLYRPKEIGDYWAMYGLGLMAIALGCAMADEGIFGVLLFLWLITFVWSLTLFYLYRESETKKELALDPVLPHTARGRRFPVFSRAGRWTVAILAFGMLCFLATPRLSVDKWVLTMRVKMETGITADSQIDLNKTGSLGVNQEVAFHVVGEYADGRKKIDLPGGQLWRNTNLVRYEAGKWSRDRQGTAITLELTTRPLPMSEKNPSRDPATSIPRNVRLPDLGPDQYFLTFVPAPSVAGLMVLSDPPYWKAGELPPIVGLASVNPERWENWRHYPDTSFIWSRGNSSVPPTWCQTRVESGPTDRGPPMYLPGNAGYGAYINYSSVSNLLTWTDALVERLNREGKLPDEALERGGPGEGRRKRVHHERIARALCEHLANSGEYTYTLDLDRRDRRLDPVEDFLYNVKAGHCERFATALVLMLRTQGIPAQIILGYRGFELMEDGSYVVRQSDAHAWVEMLTTRPRHDGDPPLPPPRDGNNNREELLVFQWLTLDPTPGLDAPGTNDSQGWLATAQNRTLAFFKEYILGFNSGLRERVARDFLEFIERAGNALANGRINSELIILALIVALPVLIVLRRRHRRPSAANREQADRETLHRIALFHARLLHLLSRHGYRPQPGETAREFAGNVAVELEAVESTQAAANVPVEAAEIYYRSRFGDMPPTAVELANIETGLTKLESALAARPGTK